MNGRLNFRESFSVSKISTPPSIQDNLDFLGRWSVVQHWREKKSGNFRMIDEFDVFNQITNVGKNYVLNSSFASGTQLTGWCSGLIDNSGFTATSVNDTMSSHTGWSEYTGISNTNRVAWGPATSTAQLLTNTTTALMVFNISVTGTLYGAFMTSNNTIGGTTGTLWSMGAFPSPTSVSGGTDQIRTAYNLSL